MRIAEYGIRAGNVIPLSALRNPHLIFWFTSARFRIIERKMTYDVAIIGGGPAGSVAGAALSRNGRRVVILEKEKFPRFRVGESLLPASSDTFERIGVKEKLDRAGFLIKHGGEISSACGTARGVYFFRNALNLRWKTSYQVDRSKFDQVLLNHAQDCGCDVRYEVSVDRCTFERETATLSCNQDTQIFHAKYVIDCSGRNALLANRLRLKEPYPHLRKFSVFAYFQGPPLPPDPDASLTRMIRADDCWYWVIPMAEGKWSVGVVMDHDHFRSLQLSPEQAFEECIRKQPQVYDRLREAKRFTPVRATADFSYRTKKMFGDRWLVAGDAAGFIDPVFSSGVHIAVYSGEQAAVAVQTALQRPRVRSLAFRRYQRLVKERLATYLKLSSGWYTQEFIEIFLQPRGRIKLTPAISTVLGGNPARRLGIKLRLQLFYLLVYLQGRTGKLVNKLSLRPDQGESETPAEAPIEPTSAVGQSTS
jgi:flavin-dependent dehydrogenase